MIRYLLPLSLCMGCTAGALVGDIETGEGLDTGDTAADTSIDTSDTGIDTSQDTSTPDLVGITYLSAPGPLDMDAVQGASYPEIIRGNATGVHVECDSPLVYAVVPAETWILTEGEEATFTVAMREWEPERDGDVEIGTVRIVSCAVACDQNSVELVVNAYRVR